MSRRTPHPARAATAAGLVLAAALAAQAPASSREAGAGGSPFLGSWAGELVVRDEPLALRLDVRRATEREAEAGLDALQAEIDFPQLVYTDQRTPVAARDGGLAVTLPFGLGEPLLRLDDDGRLAGTLEIGGSVVLERTEPFEPVRETFIFGAFEPALAGRLVLPPGEGPFPLVLLTAGSGNPTLQNWSYTSWADPLARRGIASFAYDRRPDDARKPDGGVYDIADQARDLATALDRLAADPRIDPDRLGVLGKSRGVWIGVALAAADPRIDFLVGFGGAVVSIPQQDFQAIEAKMRAAGEAEADLQAALAYTRLYFHVAAHPEHWPRLERAADEAREALDAAEAQAAAAGGGDPPEEPAAPAGAASDAPAEPDPAAWGRYVRLPDAVDDLEWFAGHLAFDPLPLYARLERPVFYAWGADDTVTPPEPNRPLLRFLLAPEALADSRLVVYPNVGHSLEGPLDTDDDPDVVWTGLSQQLLRDLWAWLEAIGVAEEGGRE